MNLTEAIKAVAPHMSKDSTLPALAGVQVRNGKVVATDWYTLAMVDVEGLDTDVEVWLSAEDVKAKPVFVTNETITFDNGSAKQVSEPRAEFPAIEKIVDNFTPNDGTTPVTSFSVDIAYMGKFASKFFPRSPGHPRFEFGADVTKPLRVTIAGLPEYVGMIVPVRTGV